MNYQTSQLWRIPYSKMLPMQASEAHWEPSQAFKMGILAKVVNGLKLFLKLWAVIGGLYEGALDTWISDTNNPTDPLGSWPFEFMVITGLLQSLRSLWSLVFLLFPVSISFACASRNPMSIEFQHIGKWETYNYIIKHTSSLCNWLL